LLEFDDEDWKCDFPFLVATMQHMKILKKIEDREKLTIVSHLWEVFRVGSSAFSVSIERVPEKFQVNLSSLLWWVEK
jgi:LEA14-like dessication related protein